jgi:hypothetical protein
MEADNVPNLRSKVGVVAELERLQPMRLASVLLPYPLHGGPAYFLLTAIARTLQCVASRDFVFIVALHNRRFRLLSDLFGATAAGTISNRAAIPPSRNRFRHKRHGRQGRGQVAGYDMICHSIGSAKNNVHRQSDPRGVLR